LRCEVRTHTTLHEMMVDCETVIIDEMVDWETDVRWWHGRLWDEMVDIINQS